MKSLFLAICLLIAGASYAYEPSTQGLDDLDKTGLLLANPLHGREAELIKRFQTKEGTTLLNTTLPRPTGSKYERITVEKMRNGEVLVVTIPASMLFLPNDTELRGDASNVLTPFKRYLRNPDMYWVVLDMHSDNTGNMQYTDSLTLERVTSVFDWFADQGADTRFLFPTASGNSEPLPGNNNLSMRERAANRRLEIYLVPGRRMVEAAKKGRIEF